MGGAASQRAAGLYRPPPPRCRPGAAELSGWAAAWARLIGGARLCEVRVEPGAFVKRRRGWAPLLIWSAEAFLRPHFHTLPLAAWQAQEIALYARLYGLPAARIPGGLRLPALPGVVLADHLRAGSKDGLRALTAAAEALYALHQVEAVPRTGPFTHGDATAHNCLYEPEAERARWFDFETGHFPGQDVAWRRADDLRALLFSAGAWLEAEPAAWLPPVMAAYPDPAVWASWRRLVASLTHYADPFHLAQTRLSPSASRDLARQMEVISGQRSVISGRQSAISNP